MNEVPVVGNLDASQHFAEELALPIIESLGAIARVREAVDVAATHRKGVVVSGPKGSGKGVAIERAMEWFRECERAKHREDATYRRRRILRVGESVRGTKYRETGVLLCRTLDRGYSDRVRRALKDPNEVREDFVQLCLRSHYSVIVLDEAERCTDDVLLFLRDFLTDAELQDSARRRVDGAKSAAGIGVVVIGTEAIHNRVLQTNEAGERWVQALKVSGLDLHGVEQALAVWFPGFAPHIEKVGRENWRAYLASALLRGDHVSFRTLENLARSYALVLSRHQVPVSCRESVPFHQSLFELALSKVTWAQTGTGREASARTGLARRDLRRTK
jgi:hypothetical protein